MQALKVLVGVMGVLIVAAVVVIAVTIYNRTARMAAAPAEFEGAALPIPPGCRIGEMTAAEGRIWLRLEGGEACNRLFVLDAGSGKLVGEIGAAAP
jgi:hypothetical protein